MDFWIIITIVSLLLSALFSGVEMAFVTSDRVRLELDVNRGGFISRIVNRFYSNSDLFISTILVGNNVVLVVYGIGAAALIEPVLENIYPNEFFVLLGQTLISTFIILLCGEFFPKTIFGINPNTSFRIMALPISVFYVILYPVSVFTSWVSRVLMRLAGVKDPDKRMRMLSVGELNDYIEETIDDMEEKKQEVDNEVKIFAMRSTSRRRMCATA